MSAHAGGSWCPECGPNGKVDEDASCAACGATCTGLGAELALERLSRQADPATCSALPLARAAIAKAKGSGTAVGHG